MECAECARLEGERNRSARALAFAIAIMNAAAAGGDDARHTHLRADVQEARVDLEIAETALQQHQRTSSHALLDAL